jgi:predicted nicotinamide N-methyase
LRWNSLGAAQRAGEETSGSVRLAVDGAEPFFHTTPSEALKPLVREKVIVDGRTFFITRPAESERIQDHPAVQTALEKHDYLPYWTDLWPAARMLAKVILREPQAPGTRVLELGSGLGLPGIAALACGLRVTFSDCDATALEFAATNARANGFRDFDLLLLDWRYPPDGLHAPIVLASDLVYELRNINPIVAFLKRVLEPDGLCLLTDQDRLPAYNLREALDGEGMAYTTQTLHAGEPGGRRTRGTLYRIRRAR